MHTPHCHARVQVRQIDQPGIVASVSSLLARESINISFMTVGGGFDRGGINVLSVDLSSVGAALVRRTRSCCCLMVGGLSVGRFFLLP
jgi:hypothetical protein